MHLSCLSRGSSCWWRARNPPPYDRSTGDTPDSASLSSNWHWHSLQSRKWRRKAPRRCCTPPNGLATAAPTRDILPHPSLWTKGRDRSPSCGLADPRQSLELARLLRIFCREFAGGKTGGPAFWPSHADAPGEELVTWNLSAITTVRRTFTFKPTVSHSNYNSQAASRPRFPALSPWRTAIYCCMQPICMRSLGCRRGSKPASYTVHTPRLVGPPLQALEASCHVP